MSRYKAYSEYRNSGIDWNEEIPSHWTTSKIRYMFSFDKGLTITKENLQDDGIPCVNYGEVHSRYGFEVNPAVHSLKCVSEQYLEVSASSLLKKGDFVFADTSEDIDGSGNFTQLVADDVTFAGYHTIIVRPHDRRSSRFYAYLFDSKELRTQIRHAVKGVKVFSITQAILRGIDIWLPSLQEREKIANFLDHETAKIDTLIAKQQELIKLLKEKRQAVISHAVTKGLNPNAPMRDSGVEWLGEVPAHWVPTRLKYLKSKEANAFVDGPFGSNLKSEHFIDEGEIYVIESNFATTGEIEPANLKRISRAHFETVKRSATKEGDIIIAKIGARYGSSAILPKLDRESLVSGNSLKLTVDVELLDIEYANELLRFLKLSEAMDDGVNITAQPALSLGGLNNLPFLRVPMIEQKQIVEYVNEQKRYFDRVVANAERLIELAKERRTALISAAVTGKIDVRDWQPPSESAIAA